jgi:diguanylate cyclase (GGDEF)-like protein
VVRDIGCNVCIGWGRGSVNSGAGHPDDVSNRTALARAAPCIINMPDEQPDQTESASSPALEPKVRKPLRVWADMGISLTVCFTSLLWLSGLILWQEDLKISWTMQVALATAALLSSGWVARRQYSLWLAPLSKMSHILSLIQQGEAPIEELSQVTGGLEPLVYQIKTLLHDKRSHEASIAQLEREMKQRIANRTDALERMIGKLQQQAARDVLTGLYNRRMLDECLPQILDRCKKESAPLCLLMIDVDHFKAVNDTLGHAAGDLLLKTIGQLINSSVRDNDLAFRYGGDEFVILLPGSTTRHGKALAQRLGDLVDAFTKTMHLPKQPRLSTGLAEADLAKDTVTTLIHRADTTLYQIKASRRSRPVAA